MENIFTDGEALRGTRNAGALPAQTIDEDDHQSEEVAVYVGRASFRMTTVCEAVREIAEAPAPSPWFSATDEHVVLPSPEGPIEPISDDELIPIAASEFVLVPPRPRSIVRRKVLPVAIAVLAGACATLSAEAVMRRVPKPAAMVAASDARTPARTQAAATASEDLPSEAIAPSAAQAVVAPSTADIPDTAATIAALGTIPGGVHSRHARTTQPAKRPALAARALSTESRIARSAAATNANGTHAHRARGLHTTQTTTVASSSAWVDPFSAPATEPQTTTAHAIAQPQPKKWVDPFAN